MGRLVRKPKLPEAAPAQASDFGGMFQKRARSRRRPPNPATII